MPDDLDISIIFTPGSIDNSSHDLPAFMQGMHDEIAREYERIQKTAREDPGTAGDQGEENWAELLRSWLPPTYHIVTKGRILSHTGVAGPQVDVLILDPAYPEHLLNKKTYLASGVVAAFECKITLRARHIRKAVQNGVELREHVGKRVGSPYRELNSPLIFGVLSHSHSWKRPSSTPNENVTKNLTKVENEHVQHPREMIDFVCVADLTTWITVKFARSPHNIQGQLSICPGTAHCSFPPRENQANSFTPIGLLVSYLWQKLAWRDTSLRRLAEYFVAVQGIGTGQADLRQWSPEIYSDSVRDELLHLPVPVGYQHISLCEDTDELWNEWSSPL